MVSIFSFFRNKIDWKNERFPDVWEEGRQSIYEFIRDNIESKEINTTFDDDELPDSKYFYKDGQLRWVGGAMGNLFDATGEFNEKFKKKIAAKILESIRQVTKKSSEKKLIELYQTLLDDKIMDYIDYLLPILFEDKKIDLNRVQKLARWLVVKSPDRNPAKVGIAILGIFQGDMNKHLFMTMGTHDEFTLYSKVALTNSLENPEMDLWALAQKVHGWGRIIIVNSFANTINKDIKQWMLREGFRNNIMHEELAYRCATTGELLKALSVPEADDELLIAAGEIIQALIYGGPAEDMDDYEDGARVTNLYMNHILKKDLNVGEFIILKAIKDFVDYEEEEFSWEEREQKGWTSQLRAELSDKAEQLLNQPLWKDLVLEKLNSDDDTVFWNATRVAEDLKIDTWPYFFERQQAGKGSNWYFFLMKTEDSERIDKVLELAEKQLSLEAISSGVADESGIGEDFKHHHYLNFIVQDLAGFPGKGWNFIKAALNSPLTRNRRAAIIALEDWGRENWPDDAEKILLNLLNEEPNEDTKDQLQAILKQNL